MQPVRSYQTSPTLVHNVSSYRAFGFPPIFLLVQSKKCKPIKRSCGILKFIPTSSLPWLILFYKRANESASSTTIILSSYDSTIVTIPEEEKGATTTLLRLN